MFLFLLILVCFMDFEFCDGFDATNKSLWMSSERDFQSKSSRLLNFHEDGGNLKMNLEFSAPFIEIPLKKSMELGRKALVNVNMAGFIFSGIALLASVIVLPTILFFVKNKLMTHESEMRCKNQLRENDIINQSEMWRYLTILDDTLMENNIDVTSCIQRYVCSTARRSANTVRTGKGSSIEKIVDGMATNDWLLHSISDTPLYEAIKAGQSNENCFNFYKTCQISHKSIHLFTNKLENLIRSFST